MLFYFIIRTAIKQSVSKKSMLTCKINIFYLSWDKEAKTEKKYVSILPFEKRILIMSIYMSVYSIYREHVLNWFHKPYKQIIS